MRERERLPGPLTCSRPSWPAPPAGPAHRRLPPLSPSSSARRTGTRPARAATRPGHLLPAWLPPPPLVPPATPRSPRPPLPSPSLSRPHPLPGTLSPPPLFLPSTNTRASSSPPFTIAAATASPSTPHRACELRLDVPDLLDKPRRHGRAATPPSPPSSSPRPAIAAVRFAAPKTPPSSLTTSSFSL